MSVFILNVQIGSAVITFIYRQHVIKNYFLVFLSNAESLAPHLLGFCLVKPEDLSNVPFIR